MQQGNLTLAQLNQVSGGQRPQELQEKQSRLTTFLERGGLGALLLQRHENLAWATAGQVEARVGIPVETAITSLLLLPNGRRFYIAPQNEAARLAAEEFNELGYEPVILPWYAASPAETIAKLAGGTRIGSDTPSAGDTLVDLGPLRAALTPAEILRYRWLGRATAAVVEGVLPALEPGDTEYQMAGQVSQLLLDEGILPSVLLMAVDDRILKYKHAVARGARLERYGMLNLCARKWGLSVSITRFVHFGALPAELAAGFDGAAKANAALQHASRKGVDAGALFTVAQQAYADAGFPGAEQAHHQGGATGYREREWVATPGGAQIVTEPQAFAWNPSVQGGKVEDTTLLVDGKIEVLTATPSLPEVETEVGGVTYISSGALIQE